MDYPDLILPQEVQGALLHHAVGSTNIDMFGVNPDKLQFFIQFFSGSGPNGIKRTLYSYDLTKRFSVIDGAHDRQPVATYMTSTDAEALYNDMLAADSPGKFVRGKIVGTYPATKLDTVIYTKQLDKFKKIDSMDLEYFCDDAFDGMSHVYVHCDITQGELVRGAFEIVNPGASFVGDRNTPNGFALLFKIIN